MPPDLRAIADQVITAVKSNVARAVEPLAGRVDALELAVRGLPSTDFVRAEVAGGSSKTTLDLLGALSKAPDGKSIAVEDVQPLIETLVAALPVPKDGAPGQNGANGRDGEPGKDGAPGQDGRPGADGASVDAAAVEAMVGAHVARALPAIAEPAREVSEASVKELADAFVAQLMAATVG